MKNIEKKLDDLRRSLVGIALILVSLWVRDTEYISIPLAIIGLIVCIVASPLLRTKEERRKDENADTPPKE